MAVARILAHSPTARTVELVGFTLEEPQHGSDGRFRHGSRRFAKRVRNQGKSYEGVFILESVGYTDSRFGGAAKEAVPELSTVSYEAPLRGWIMPMVRWSDHAPFWDRGYPALMLTDTAPLRNPHYHQPTDTPDTLDYTFLTNVTRALLAGVASL